MGENFCSKRTVAKGIGSASFPVVGNILGTALGVLDHFLLERILPFSGPAAFMNELYPSIFLSRGRKYNERCSEDLQ